MGREVDAIATPLPSKVTARLPNSHAGTRKKLA
jgi:hypothetical protein